MSNVLIISIAFLGIFILYILNKRNKGVQDYTLILLNLICGLLLYSVLKVQVEMTPTFFFLHNTLPFWLFSVFMLYASQLISHKAWQKYYFLFFAFCLPFTLFLLYDVFIAHEDFNEILESRFLNPPFIYHFFFKGNMIYAIILCFGLLKKLKEYSLTIQNNFSYIEEMQVKWLRHYTIALICLYAFSLIGFLLYNVGLIEKIDGIYAVLNMFVIIAFFYFSFNGVKHYNLQNIPAVDKTNISTVSSNILEIKETPLVKSIPADEKSQHVYQEVLDLFDETKLFTQAKLKLSDVAEQMNIPAHQLSQIINANYGKPFYDFVATYRVDLLKEKLLISENKQFTILSLGLDCGFNSKASLNRVFKEHTGQTPSQYQKSHLPK